MNRGLKRAGQLVHLLRVGLGESLVELALINDNL